MITTLGRELIGAVAKMQYIICKVIPNSRKCSVEQLDVSSVPEKFMKWNPSLYLRVYVKFAPKEGKANREVVKCLEDYLGKEVILITGRSNKYKVFRLV